MANLVMLRREMVEIGRLMENKGLIVATEGNLSVRLGGHLFLVTPSGVGKGDLRVQDLLEVGDDGCGMTPEVLDRIFEPFFTTKPVGKGTGLGMSICYGIVHSWGGRLEAESEPGRGTTIRIRLPQPERAQNVS